MIFGVLSVTGEEADVDQELHVGMGDGRGEKGVEFGALLVVIGNNQVTLFFFFFCKIVWERFGR